MSKIINRWQEGPIQSALHTRRVLLLSGPRQCGKTTLAKKIAGENSTYRTLDHQAMRTLALSDPSGFLRHANQLLIIDEVQRAPELLSAIKLAVDENTKPGQFLLTGSTNLSMIPSMQESLAGRIRKIRLRPFSYGEQLGTAPTFLDHAFQKKFHEPKKHWDRQTILNIAFHGGYPEALTLNQQERKHWHTDYIQALLERDLPDITHIQRLSEMKKLIQIIAGWSGKLMDISSIGTSLSIRRPTIESYLAALEALYLAETVPAWTKTDYERVGKQNKIYMTDTGQMSAILNWNQAQIELDGDRSGKLVETFVFTELSAILEASKHHYECFHYRDREKREIDFLIQNENQALLGIEVKAGSVINSSDFKHLKWFQDNIAKDNPFTGIVLYTGNSLGKMGENLFAVPMGCLWS